LTNSHKCAIIKGPKYNLPKGKFRFIELLIFEFVRRGDLWSPAKCFEFAENLVIIPQFHHCRFTTMTGRPQVAPTVLYDKLLDKSEFGALRRDGEGEQRLAKGNKAEQRGTKLSEVYPMSRTILNFRGYNPQIL